MQSSLKFAVFSDVHSNTFALEAVLQDIRSHSPDLLLNLGDQVWGQVDPLGALELQASLGAVEIRGNNEEKPFMTSGLNKKNMRFAAWVAARIPPESLQRLNALPTSQLVADGRILAAHGTPLSPWPKLLWQSRGGRLTPRDVDEIRNDLSHLPDSVKIVVVGHTHLERVTRLDGRLLVNVGPVSRQTDGDPRARWSLIQYRNGGWNVEMHHVEYDWQAASDAVRRNDPVEPDEAEMLLGW